MKKKKKKISLVTLNVVTNVRLPLNGKRRILMKAYRQRDNLGSDYATNM